MREHWACPDKGAKREDGTYLPVPGSKYLFDDCPAYYLRTVGMGLPAVHLIDGHIHPAQIIGEYAFEIENGSRNVDTLSPKARELVHLHLSEKASREAYASEKRRKERR